MQLSVSCNRDLNLAKTSSKKQENITFENSNETMVPEGPPVGSVTMGNHGPIDEGSVILLLCYLDEISKTIKVRLVNGLKNNFGIK